MRLEVVQATRIPRAPVWAAILVLAWGALAALVVSFGDGTPVCIFRRATGVPCVACGGTRATLSLWHGDVAGALAFNPLIALGLPVLLVYLLFRTLTARAVRIDASPREQSGLWGVVILAVAANWVYVILRGD